MEARGGIALTSRGFRGRFAIDGRQGNGIMGGPKLHKGFVGLMLLSRWEERLIWLGRSWFWSDNGVHL